MPSKSLARCLKNLGLLVVVGCLCEGVPEELAEELFVCTIGFVLALYWLAGYPLSWLYVVDFYFIK